MSVNIIITNITTANYATEEDGNNTDICETDYCNWTEETFRLAIYKLIYPKYYEWIFIILFLHAFVFGLVGNFLVCYVIWKNNHLQTITNNFLMNLAVADFMVILVCLPPTVVHHIMESWFIGLAMCKIVGYIQVGKIY